LITDFTIAPVGLSIAIGYIAANARLPIRRDPRAIFVLDSDYPARGIQWPSDLYLERLGRLRTPFSSIH
jgi:hypothetical protein